MAGMHTIREENREWVRKLSAARARILDDVGGGRHLNMTKIIKDKIALGALASLQSDSLISPVSELDLNTGLWKFKLVHDERERTMLDDARKAKELDEMVNSPTMRAAAKRMQERGK